MQPTIEQMTAAFIGAHLRLDEDEQRLAQAIYRLLAEGRPAPLAAIAERGGWSVADVEDRLGVWPAVFRNSDGAVAGFWGLASDAVTDHRVDFEGIGTAWTWCSYDTLFITPLIGATARVTSRCASTGTTVQLTVSADGVRDLTPDTAVVSMLLPDRPVDDNVRQTLCHYVLFFASPEAADRWTGKHPATFSLPVADAFEVARRQNAVVFDAIVDASEPTAR